MLGDLDGFIIPFTSLDIGHCNCKQTSNETRHFRLFQLDLSTEHRGLRGSVKPYCKHLNGAEGGQTEGERRS